MNARHFHNSLIVAARMNPACRRASIWTIETDTDGNHVMLDDGNYKWTKLCMAYVTFNYGPADQWAGATGEYGNDFKLSVIPEAITRAPFVLPDLGETFIVRRFPKMGGDPTPELTLAVQRIGGASAGIQQQYLAREPELADVWSPILNAPEPTQHAPWGFPD